MLLQTGANYAYPNYAQSPQSPQGGNMITLVILFTVCVCCIALMGVGYYAYQQKYAHTDIPEGVVTDISDKTMEDEDEDEDEELDQTQTEEMFCLCT